MNDKDTFASVKQAALTKQELSLKKPSLFFAKAFLAGIFITLGIALSLCAGAAMLPLDAGIARIVNALSMPVALMLIIFIGGELFTGANFVMSIGFYEKTCSVSGVMRVWLLCLLGNLTACVIFGALFAFCGTGGDALKQYLTETINAKFSLPWNVLIIRGIFANFCVCCAVLAGFRLKSETAKIIIILFCIFAFVVCGFEHSIANITLFSVSVFIADGFDFTNALGNIVLTVAGNIIGGAVMLGLPYWIVNRNE